LRWLSGVGGLDEQRRTDRSEGPSTGSTANDRRYHEQQLGLLLEGVREGFARMDAGEIDAFELDELIHRYQRSISDERVPKAIEPVYRTIGTSRYRLSR
jgi:hypothetical protein